MTASRPLRRPRPLRRALPSVIAACLLLAVSLPLAGPAAAARPHKGDRPHQDGSPTPAPSGPPASTVISVATTQSVIALTFDDGWDATRCLAIASVLDRYGIPATFFPNGVYVRRSPAIWRSIGARFPIGNHTYHHPDLRDLSDTEIVRELERNRKTIEDITGRPMAPLLRPPYGAANARVAKVAGGLGYTHLVLWDTSDGDTGPHATEHGTAKAALRGGPGSIVLMHCGPEVTPAILPVVIERYACDGVRFATVEELLAGSSGHGARVDCPPLPLPEKPHPHGSPSPEPSGMPEPSAMPELPSPEPTDLASAAPSPSPTPILIRDLPVTLVRWLDQLTSELAHVLEALPSSAPSASPSAGPSEAPTSVGSVASPVASPAPSEPPV